MRSFAGCQEHYGSLPRAPNADEPPGAAIGGECAVRDGIGVDSEVVADFFFAASTAHSQHPLIDAASCTLLKNDRTRAWLEAR